MKQKYLTLISLAGFLFSIDQMMKLYVRNSMMVGGRRDLLGFLELVHTQNRGFVFGLLPSLSKELYPLVIIGVPVFAVVLIILIFIKLQDNEFFTSFALTAIVAGALGNLLDRLQYGYVVDYFSLQFGKMNVIPAFNLADFSIILGVALMFIHTLRPQPKDVVP